MLGTGVTDVAHRVSDHLLTRVCFQSLFESAQVFAKEWSLSKSISNRPYNVNICR